MHAISLIYLCIVYVVLHWFYMWFAIVNAEFYNNLWIQCNAVVTCINIQLTVSRIFLFPHFPVLLIPALHFQRHPTVSLCPCSGAVDFSQSHPAHSSDSGTTWSLLRSIRPNHTPFHKQHFVSLSSGSVLRPQSTECTYRVSDDNLSLNVWLTDWLLRFNGASAQVWLCNYYYTVQYFHYLIICQFPQHNPVQHAVEFSNLVLPIHLISLLRCVIRIASSARHKS